MHARSEQGLPPASFDVIPLPLTNLPVPDPTTTSPPVSHQAVFSAGTALIRKGDFAAALGLLDEAARLDPGHAATHSNRAAALLHLGRYDAAAVAGNEATKVAPDFADGWNNFGSALMKLQRPHEALAAYDKAVALAPTTASMHNNRGMALDQMNRPGEAALAYARVRELDPAYRGILSSEVFALRKACLWPGPGNDAGTNAASEQELLAKAKIDEPVAPFVLVALSDDPALLLEAARRYCAQHCPPARQALWRGERYTHARIRIAYLSADFHNHAVACKTVELFELHDRNKFECFAYSFGRYKEGPMRARLEKAFEHFIDVSDLTDLALAQRLRTDEIDIAVDLMGYTKDCRPGVFARRPVPVTMSYIGFPGSSGAPWMDYMLADAVVIPRGDERYYSEQVVRMPHSYQVNDRQYEIADRTPSRADVGLPEDAFVFCCFNNPYKISQQQFALWMRVLGAVEGSVLWLFGKCPEVKTNLLCEAQRFGISEGRLVFAESCGLPEHLARLRCADLFLDTLPYNGHATASDTLWAGLPLLTCTGRSFASRVAASLLLALDLPELVTHSLADYEARALQLARNPSELAALRQKLASKRLTAPLFDTPRFTRYLERAYRHMHDRSRQGLLPAAFDVGALPAEPETGLEEGGSDGQPPVLSDAVVNSTANQAGQMTSHKEALRAGTALIREGRYEEAVTVLDQAVKFDQAHATTHSNRAAALFHAGRYEEAARAAQQATLLAPEFADAWNNLGSALMKLQRPGEALLAFDKALAQMPDMASTHNNRGMALDQLNRPGAAALAYARVRQLDAGYRGIHSAEVFSLRKACLWLDAQPGTELVAVAEQDLIERARAGEQVSPFVLMAMSADPALLLTAARNYGAQRYPPAPQPLWQGPHYAHERIRLAYLSADFHSHATAHLMAELFELHDRSRFDLWAYSFGPGKSGPVRERLERAFDHFHDVAMLSDLDVAHLLRQHEIDIAVDLKGYTQDCRPGILGHRPAPVQVNYLGFPGSMGSPVIDYMVADTVLIPPDQEQYYSEQIVRLPNSYQVNDRTREIAASAGERSDHGLPKKGVVFCCFNNTYKLTSTLFDIWMRLLLAVPGSVLWLLASNEEAPDNLRRAAGLRGVDPSRLVFAPKLPLAEHLARHQHASLFLDTLPCNAHTTASDALWAGLPVLTCLGATFAGRVAASLLHAIDLPELVTSTLDEYEALAFQLATNPARLSGLRRKLASRRLSTPLFDTGLFCRHLEAAYLTMHERARQGLPPQAFSVPASLE